MKKIFDAKFTIEGLYYSVGGPLLTQNPPYKFKIMVVGSAAVKIASVGTPVVLHVIIHHICNEVHDGSYQLS